MYGHGGTNGGGGGAGGLIRAKMAKRDHSCRSGSGPMRRLHISGLVSNGELAKGQWWRCTAAVKPHMYRGPGNNSDTSTETKYYYVNIDCAEKSKSLREKILTMYMGLTLKEC